MSREPGAGSREPGAGSREPGAGSREPGAGSREPGAGSREPGKAMYCLTVVKGASLTGHLKYPTSLLLMAHGSWLTAHGSRLMALA